METGGATTTAVGAAGAVATGAGACCGTTTTGAGAGVAGCSLAQAARNATAIADTAKPNLLIGTSCRKTATVVAIGVPVAPMALGAAGQLCPLPDRPGGGEERGSSCVRSFPNPLLAERPQYPGPATAIPSRAFSCHGRSRRAGGYGISSARTNVAWSYGSKRRWSRKHLRRWSLQRKVTSSG